MADHQQRPAIAAQRCGGGSASSSWASATRNRSPPDRVPTGRLTLSPRSRNRARWARTTYFPGR